MSEIQKLTNFLHARKRSEMYIGSRDPHSQTVLSYGPNGPFAEEMTWVPAVFTAFREIFDNAMDEVVGHGHGTEIHVKYDKNTMTFMVKDNGRGIPITYDDVHKKHAATMAVSETMAGRNFNDEERGQSRGLNGVGAAIVNYTSEYFTVEINRDGKTFNQSFREGEDDLIIDEPIILPTRSKATGTQIDFKLSPKVFQHFILPEDFLRSRIYEASLCFPNVRFYFNGQQVRTKGVEKDLFHKRKPIVFSIEEQGFKSDFWLVPGFFEDGTEFSHSLVNGIPMFNGGTHLDAFRKNFFSGMLEALSSTSKRKKLNPNRSDLADGMLIYNITLMDSPQFDSQSKSRVINEKIAKLVQNALADPDFFKSVIRKNPDWIESVYERCAERTLKRDSADLAKAARSNKRLKIPELDDATGSARMDCGLFLCEGKSAVSGVIEARNPQLHGALPLRGKVLNVYGKHLTKTAQSQNLKKIAENEALKKVAAAIGLVVGQTAVRSQLRYGKVYIATDADHDGSNICALLVNYFYQLWPELFKPDNPFLFIFQTPFIIAKKGKEKKYWYSDDVHAFNPEDYKGWEITRAKGLAALKKDDWKYSLEKPKLTPVIDEGDLEECLDLLFSPDADARKEWLGNDI